MTSTSQQQTGEQLTNRDKHLLQISRLEDEKESLILQVSVLTDQVEAQGEKIRDLEFTKEEMQIKLEEAEQFLESVSRYLDITALIFLYSSASKISL